MMDKEAFEKLKRQVDGLERDVARVRSRAGALNGRLDAVVLAAKGGLATLSDAGPSDGRDLTQVRQKIQQVVTNKIEDISERAHALATTVQDLPTRVTDLSNPAHWETLRGSARALGGNARDAAVNLGVYVANAIPDDVFSPSLEMLEERVEAIETGAKAAAEQIEQGFGDWNGRLENAAETIAELQEKWTNDLATAWEGRGAELSAEFAERVAAVRQRGSDLIEKIGTMVETVNTAFDGLSDLRETVETGSQAAQGGLGTITELITEVKGLLDAVK